METDRSVFSSYLQHFPHPGTLSRRVFSTEEHSPIICRQSTVERVRWSFSELWNHHDDLLLRQNFVQHYSAGLCMQAEYGWKGTVVLFRALKAPLLFICVFDSALFNSTPLAFYNGARKLLRRVFYSSKFRTASQSHWKTRKHHSWENRGKTTPTLSLPIRVLRPSSYLRFRKSQLRVWANLKSVYIYIYIYICLYAYMCIHIHTP